MKKKIVLPSVLALAILATVLTATNVFANDLSDYPPIVQEIAEKFDLDEGDVEQVFDEEKDERRAEAFALFADRLDDLVDEGEITQTQRDAILDKHEEIQDAREEYQYFSAEERREKARELNKDYQNWSIEQGLDKYIFV